MSEPLIVKNTDSYNLDTRNTRKIINEIRASFGAPPTTMTDEQIEAGREVYGAKLDYDMVVIDEVQDTRERLEADIQLSAMHLEFDDGYRSVEKVLDMVPLSTVYKWLDRQAAITSLEWLDGKTHIFGMTFDEVRGLQAKVNELIAERDEWKSECSKLTDKIGEITNEASELMKKQPYTFDVHDVPRSLQTVRRYIDELRAELETYRKYTDQGECKKQQPMESGDTREKLNEELMDSCLTFADHGGHLRAFSYVSKLLDRQAAITIRECTSEDESCCEACRAAQKRKIAELTIERDELQKVVRIQAESFRKMEQELKEAKDALRQADDVDQLDGR